MVQICNSILHLNVLRGEKFLILSIIRLRDDREFSSVLRVKTARKRVLEKCIKNSRLIKKSP